MNTPHPPFTIRSSIVLCCALLMASGAQAKGNKKVTPQGEQSTLSQPYVTINGEAQSNARAEVLFREQIARGAKDSPELRNGVREALINQAMMAQEARKASLDKNPLVQAQIELAQQNVLANAWQQKVLSETRVTDEEIKAEYERQVARMGDQQYLVRHLLVADEATARQLIERIKGGAKMADLAAESSRDNETRGRGGLTDWTLISNFLPPVAEAIARIEKGQLSPQPVQTAQGWHVLQLEEKRSFTPPTLEASKAQVADLLARQALEAKALTLKKQARVQ